MSKNKEPLADGIVKLGQKTKVLLKPTMADIEIKTGGEKVNETKERILNKVMTIRGAQKIAEATHIGSHEAERLVALAKRKGRNVTINKMDAGIDDAVEKPRIRVKAVTRKVEPEAKPEPEAQAPKPVVKTAELPAPVTSHEVKPAAQTGLTKAKISTALVPVNHETGENPMASEHLKSAQFHHSEFKRFRQQVRASQTMGPGSLAQGAWGNLGMKGFKNRATKASSMMRQHETFRNNNLKQYLNTATPSQLSRFNKDHANAMVMEAEEKEKVDIRFHQNDHETVVYARFADKWERFHVEPVDGRELSIAKTDLIEKMGAMGYNVTLGPDIETVKEAEELMEKYPTSISRHPHDLNSHSLDDAYHLGYADARNKMKQNPYDGHPEKHKAYEEGHASVKEDEELTEASDITFHEVNRDSDPESVQHTLNHAFGAVSSKTYKVHHKGMHIGYATESTHKVTKRTWSMSHRGQDVSEELRPVAHYSPRNAHTEKVDAPSLEHLKPKITEMHNNPPRWLMGKLPKLNEWKKETMIIHEPDSKRHGDEVDVIEPVDSDYTKVVHNGQVKVLNNKILRKQP